MALAPLIVQCIPARFRRVPIETLHPASTTPPPEPSPCTRVLDGAFGYGRA